MPFPDVFVRRAGTLIMGVVESVAVAVAIAYPQQEATSA